MYSLESVKDFKIDSVYSAGVFQNEKPEDSLNGFSDRIEAVFVNSGKLRVVCDSKSYLCSSGTVAFFKPYELHYIKLLDDEYTEFLAVSFSVLPDSQFEFFNKVTSLNILQKQLVQSICNTVIANNEANILLPQVFTNDTAKALKLSATIKLLAVDIAVNEDNIVSQNTRDSLVFEKAVSEMKNNLFGQLSLEELAKELDVSLSHLKRVFASFADVGVHEYFMGLKICEAIKMLKNGVSVTETADTMGFNNQNYFSSAFKRIVGTSPKEYTTVKKKVTINKTKVYLKPETVVKEKKTASDMPSYLL